MARREPQAAVVSLIGSFAETATYVRQRRVDGHGSATKLRFQVGTGELSPTPALLLTATS